LRSRYLLTASPAPSDSLCWCQSDGAATFETTELETTELEATELEATELEATELEVTECCYGPSPIVSKARTPNPVHPLRQGS
jgi:hypothetical protein